jgi:hypothetical protein
LKYAATAPTAAPSTAAMIMRLGFAGLTSPKAMKPRRAPKRMVNSIALDRARGAFLKRLRLALPGSALPFFLASPTAFWLRPFPSARSTLI